ncbi:hypothetical protein KGR20_20380 [Cytobacillus oceanisediminis]|uniref:MFS transporter n=1 Tax=Niallia alba TaxID=2729105 RepID=A0A7Y0K4K7_9BACI|nr:MULTISPECIES: hypothetical protein [Bacillaceae]MBZ9536529.1 hypothetical protein [Cytobacillus oceanisediminis]NMO75698.1 hypothetical protein [Niallia alba]UTI43495.1 hypothetical protein NKG37_07410 [Niallia sp. RD1]
MLHVITKCLYRLSFFIMGLFYSILFTIFFYPLSVKYLEFSIMDYFLFSMFLLALGGAFFDRAFTYFYLDIGNDYEAINKVHYVAMFVGKVIAYIVAGMAIYFFKKDFYLSLYIPVFLLTGGWIWFSILKGYIKVKREKEGNLEVKFKTKVGY